MDIFQNLWSTRYLSDDPSGTPSAFFAVLTAFFALLMIASIIAYVRRRKLSRGITPRRHLIRNVAKAGMWISGTGLFLAIMRYVNFQYLDARWLMYALGLITIAYVGYVTFYLSERYSGAVRHFQQAELDRRYRATAKRKPAATPVQSRPAVMRGKRRR